MYLLVLMEPCVFCGPEEQARNRFQSELEFVQCLANPNYLNCESGPDKPTRTPIKGAKTLDFLIELICLSSRNKTLLQIMKECGCYYLFMGETTCLFVCLQLMKSCLCCSFGSEGLPEGETLHQLPEVPAVLEGA